MTFHVLTIFPEFFRGPFEHGVVARARETGRLEIRIHNLRDWTGDRHKTVDDRPFGGGEGMLLKPEPVFAAVETIFPERGRGARDPQRRVILLSAQGQKFHQAAARRLSSGMILSMRAETSGAMTGDAALPGSRCCRGQARRFLNHQPEAPARAR